MNGENVRLINVHVRVEFSQGSLLQCQVILSDSEQHRERSRAKPILTVLAKLVHTVVIWTACRRVHNDNHLDNSPPLTLDHTSLVRTLIHGPDNSFR